MGLTAAIVGGGLAAAGGIAGAAISSSGSQNAANTQANAATTAANAALESTKYQSDSMLQAANQSNSLQELMYLLGYQAQQPYQQTGTEALLTIKDLLQPGGYLAQTAPQFQFDTSKVAEDPGYDFALNEGLKAIQRSAAAKGTLLNGATGKALERYGTDYATTKVNDVYNRDLSTYNTNTNTENMNRTNLFNRLSSLAGTGQQVSSQLASAGNQLGANIGNTTTGTAGNVANIGMSGTNAANDYLTSAAAARASGYAGSGNAWGSALSQISGLPMEYMMLSKLAGG